MPRLIIAGSRAFRSYRFLEIAVDAFVEECGIDLADLTVISGVAAGADILGEVWAKNRGMPIEHYKPEWKQFGKAAGPKRNEQMAQTATHCIVFPIKGHSIGSYDMIRRAQAHNLITKVMETEIW